MGIPIIDMNDRKVFREKIKEHRGSYFVSYQPADARYSFALVQLTFLDDGPDAPTVKETMENELNLWLKRYPVPVMITAFDAKDDVISLSEEFGGSNLIGHVELPGNTIVRRWGLSKDDESPLKEMDGDYLERVYHDVPFKLQKDVREKVIREARTSGKIIRIIVFFVVGVPVLIEIVGLGIEWMGYILSGISISTGIYKTAKAMGWLKPSKRDKQKAEKDRKMQHYFYHCELNPDGFNRLKVQNWDREAIEQTRKELEALGRNNT